MIEKHYPDPLRDWAKIRNVWARDARLDWDSLGLLTYLSTHADGFEVTLQTLYSARLRTGRHALDRMVRQLKELGYLRIERHRVKGRWTSTTWHLLDPTDSAEMEG
jgi:hypothetical protein